MNPRRSPASGLLLPISDMLLAVTLIASRRQGFSLFTSRQLTGHPHRLKSFRIRTYITDCLLFSLKSFRMRSYITEGGVYSVGHNSLFFNPTSLIPLFSCVHSVDTIPLLRSFQFGACAARTASDNERP